MCNFVSFNSIHLQIINKTRCAETLNNPKTYYDYQVYFFQRTAILHLFGALRDRNTQTKYFKSEVGVETMHLSSQTRGSISPSAHTETDSPLCPTFHSTHVAIFKMTLFAEEANDSPQVWYSLSVHTHFDIFLYHSVPQQNVILFFVKKQNRI